jgi:hypothetical protein
MMGKVTVKRRGDGDEDEGGEEDGEEDRDEDRESDDGKWAEVGATKTDGNLTLGSI